MATTRKPRTTRARKPRATKADTTGVSPVDIAEDIIKEPDENSGRVAPPRATKASPKKVLDETGKAIADVGAVGLVRATGKSDKKAALLFSEAQSITTPITRIIGRRLPNWLKRLFPKVSIGLSPEDTADIEEIAVTLMKYAMRVLALTMQEYALNKEKAVAQQQQRTATSQAQPRNVVSMSAQRTQPAQPQQDVQAVTSTYNPAFDGIGADYGALEA